MLQLLLLLIITTLHVSGENGTAILTRQKRTLPIAVNEENGQLLKEAVGWMTFRRNGVLQYESKVGPLFLEPVKQKYIRSKFYRTFVVAFRLGVLPRLTLNEGADCDPAYTLKYKDPYNNSVTWHYQKKFTFDMYDNRMSSTSQFCDYRQGLVCKSITKKCQCPEGSEMQEIARNNTLKRCVYKENQICNLIDLDHGNDPKHTALASNMYHIIFNLEKPVGCQKGTQCRYTDDDGSDGLLPYCYERKKGNWFPPPPVIKPGLHVVVSFPVTIGDECSIGLYAEPGSCDSPGSLHDNRIGSGPGYVCYNFGPPRSISSSNPGKESIKGYCFFEWGPTAGFSKGDRSWPQHFRPYFISFVNPRTVPFRREELRDYYRKYMSIIQWCFLIGGSSNIQVDTEGGRCSVDKTAKFEDVWKYFSSLEDDPPQGQDYVKGATKTELDAKLQVVIDMCADPAASKKICKIYALTSQEYTCKCVKDGNGPDKDGNGGTCQREVNTITLPHTKKFMEFKELSKAIEEEQENEERNYRKDILEGVQEPQCLPELGMAPLSRGLQNTLEGGYCPDGSVCFLDYSDVGKKYDSNCGLLVSLPLPYVCHDSGDDVQYSQCETVWQDMLLSDELKKTVEYTYLERGQECQHDVESSIRSVIHGEKPKANKYRMLSLFEKSKLSGKSEGGLCDSSKLLECTSQGFCECREHTQPRKVNIAGQEYQSDYCYSTQGYCNDDPTQRMRLTDPEKEKLWKHYRNPSTDSLCNGNFCLFLDTDEEECTVQNTEKTGFDPDLTAGTNMEKPGSDEGPGWLVAGVSAPCSKIQIILLSPLISIATAQITFIF